MGVHKPLARKRRVWLKPTKLACTALSRRLMLVAMLRARKPITVPIIPHIWPRSTTPQDGVIQTIAPLRPSPFPPILEELLVDPSEWRKLPSKLETPTFPQVKPERVTIAQPAYEGLSPKQVRSGWSHMGYKVLGMYRKIYLDPPKPGLPDGYNLLVTDNGLANSATHILAVYPYAPPSTYGPAARRHKSFGFRREVCLYPTHAAIWAAYCSRLPEMPKKPSKLKIIADSRQATQRAFVLRLPMVPIALPCPPMFLPIMQFVYMYRRGRFVNALLPCSDFMLPPDHQLDPLPQEAIPQYAQALAATSDLPKLCRYAKNVHGAYRNMVALGVVEERMWEALHYAWETILTAMDLAEKAQEAS